MQSVADVGVPRGTRRTYVAILLTGAAGAGLVLLAARQGWAAVVSGASRPLPASVTSVTGLTLRPLIGALSIAALASLAAVLATRGPARRVVGVLLVAFGVCLTVAVWLPVAAGAVLSAARSVQQPSASTSSTAIAGSPQAGNDGLLGLGTAGHVRTTATGWQVLATVGSLGVAASGSLVFWRARQLPVMSGRFERRAGGGTARSRGGQAIDAASAWEALSRGEDPTAT